MNAATSSSEAESRALDTMILVYALLQGHPASTVCEQFIRAKQGWFTSALHLLEAHSVLTKVYGVVSNDSAQAIQSLANCPLRVVPVDISIVNAALHTAVSKNLDLTDAVLLETCRLVGATRIATEDALLARIGASQGMTIETPFDDVLRQQVSQWEAAHLPSKGVARVLRRVHNWLTTQADSEVAALFWSHTAGGSHLP